MNDSGYNYIENHTFPKDLAKHKAQFKDMTLDVIVSTKARLIGRAGHLTSDRYSFWIKTIDYSEYTHSIMKEIYCNTSLCEGGVAIKKDSYVWFGIAWDKRKGYYAFNVTQIVDGEI